MSKTQRSPSASRVEVNQRSRVARRGLSRSRTGSKLVHPGSVLFQHSARRAEPGRAASKTSRSANRAASERALPAVDT